ncbi:pantoate--beta-alanine ligase [Corynebacterium sp. NML98-0116]|uniref:pantoate--beta-alanine ligase n=1 Tax=unclassified Corynebacterium TaxID=2624378 RepID=UPI000877EF99|nr:MULTISPECIES: pantoate--beta-alanine ligase [unclassified Corynebacterium]AOX05031.1 pantoate--beta-alanine ligase [Corynebacterium sp. NML98-0116]MDK8363986.1 pantoate--beta-alanine ligase [Corynebacterium sp. UMB10119B]
MTFEPGNAVVVRDEQLLATYGRAFRKIGKTIAVVPLGADVHAGHIELIRAAKSLLGAYVFVTYSGEEVPETFRNEGVDVVFHGELRTAVSVRTGMEHLDDADAVSRDVARILAVLNATHATDLVMGEKDFELLVATQLAVSGLRMEVKLHSVPTVRMPDGLALSLRNERVAEDAHDQALALSAALTAGAHAAEHGAETVLDTVRGVLEAAGVTPAYLAVRDLAMREAPAQGDARLLAAIDLPATDGGTVRLHDNVGLPLGIGFKHIED